MNLAIHRDDLPHLERIIERAAELTPIRFDRLNLAISLVACHLNGCPLLLKALSEAEDSAFISDVWGIHIHLDNTTGRLTCGWLPRYRDPGGDGVVLQFRRRVL